MDVREEIELVLRELTPAITEAGATVQNRVPANLKVKADKPRFERLIANLLSNSINSKNTDGSLEIIIISVVPNGKHDGIQLSIDSNGSGRSWGRRVASESSSRSPLNGLAAAKSISEQHGWSISSEPLTEQRARLKVDIRTIPPVNTAH